MDIPEISLKLESVQVKGGITKKLCVRNVFYVGVIGKLKTIWFWLKYNRDQSFKSYLDSPIKHSVDYNSAKLHCYHSINAEAELTELLENERNEKEQTS
jgi:hypothetical protein